MSLKKMSYKTAEKIVDIYSALLVNMTKTSEFNIYGYSELQGYTVFDVDHALKIIIAYGVFNLKDENDLTRLKKYASHASAAVFSFFSNFVQDEVIPEIEKLDRNDKLSILKLMELQGDYMESEIYKQFGKQETHDSFLNFCLEIPRSDENYWERVYDRLQLVFDTKDTKDNIFIIVNNKSTFFK